MRLIFILHLLSAYHQAKLSHGRTNMSLSDVADVGSMLTEIARAENKIAEKEIDFKLTVGALAAQSGISLLLGHGKRSACPHCLIWIVDMPL